MAILAIGTIGEKPPVFDEVSARLAEKDPPDGLILQSAGDHGGVFKTFSVWETVEQHDAFVENVLRPTIKEVVGEEAFAAMPVVERDIIELDQLIVP